MFLGADPFYLRRVTDMLEFYIFSLLFILGIGMAAGVNFYLCLTGSKEKRKDSIYHIVITAVGVLSILMSFIVWFLRIAQKG